MGNKAVNNSPATTTVFQRRHWIVSAKDSGCLLDRAEIGVAWPHCQETPLAPSPESQGALGKEKAWAFQ